MAAPTENEIEDHFKSVSDAIAEGALAVFLGAGVNMAQGPSSPRDWKPSSNYLPSGKELANYLAKLSGFPLPSHYSDLDAKRRKAKHRCPVPKGDKLPLFDLALKTIKEMAESDLAVVSQYVQSSAPNVTLRRELHAIFERILPLTSFHKALAKLPGKPKINRKPIFITTNYDTLVEQALAFENEPFDVIYYREGTMTDPSPFRHWKNAHSHYEALVKGTPPPLRKPDIPIERPETYSDLPLGNDLERNSPDLMQEDLARSIVIKMHGTVSPRGFAHSNFVISQNDYIAFLRNVSTTHALPRLLAERLIDQHFLFIGYGLADWNIMAICQNLWANRKSTGFDNWAVQPNPSPADRQRWQSSADGVNISLFEMDATTYAGHLSP